MDRTIACFNARHLEIALIRRIEPGLATRAVAIVEPTPAGTALRDVSDEAAADGVAAGMAPHEARALCGGITLIRHSRQRLRRARECLLMAVAQRAPLWEPEGAGKVYADFTGTVRVFAAGVDTARRIMAELADRHGLEIAAGIGTNKLVTHVAVEASPGPGMCDIRPGDERKFLRPFPPTVLPQARRESWRPILDVLDDLNLRRLEVIAATPLPQLRVAVGPAAATLHRSANGLDDRAVVPARQRTSIDVVQALGSGESDRRRIAGILYGMLENVCRRLRTGGRACLAVRTTVVYADYAEASSAFKPARPSHWEHDLAPAIDLALARAAARRIRIRSLALEVTTVSDPPVQLPLSLGVVAAPRSVPGPHGRPGHDRRRELVSTLDAIRNRFGNPAIGWGSVPRLGTPA